MNSVVLFSGGVDSLGGIAHLLQRDGSADVLYVKLGHKYQAEEQKAVAEILESLKERGLKVNLKLFSAEGLGQFEEEDANLPGRNMYLAMIAANMGYSEIHIITQMYETSIPDRSKDFFESASRILSSLYHRDICIKTPFWDMSKSEIVKYLMRQGFEKEIFLSWACYSPANGEPCAQCSACFRRFIALYSAGLYEPYFEMVPTAMYDKYAYGNYPEGRKEEVLRVWASFRFDGARGRLKFSDLSRTPTPTGETPPDGSPHV